MQKIKSQSKNWRKVKSGILGRVITGKTPPTKVKKYFGTEYPFITPSDIFSFDVRYDYQTERFLSAEWYEKAKTLVVPKNSIGFVCIGSTIGKMCLTKEKSFTNQQINTVIVNPEKADFKYIYYLLKNNQRNIIKEYGGGGVAKAIINKSTFENIEFFIPENINEQKRIAEILSAFDDKIELNNKINQTLERMAQEIFKEWFIKSEKLKGKSEKLGNLANIKYGRGPASNQLKKNGYPVYGASGVIGYFNSYNFPDRQIIVGCRGVVGNVTLTLPECIVTHNSLIIAPRNERKLFFYYLLRNQNLGVVVGGSAQPQITITDLERLDILMPDEKLQDRFELIVGDIEQKRLIIFYENQKLASLRDLLLPKLMSGEINR